MNATYTWSNDEIVVAERMKDLQRQSEAIRLLHDADLSEAHVYTHKAAAFGRILVRLEQWLHGRQSLKDQITQTTASKHAV